LSLVTLIVIGVRHLDVSRAPRAEEPCPPVEALRFEM